MVEFLKNTVEYQAWGWNAVTVGAVGTVFFTFIQGWSFIEQGRAIWRERSGQSISVVTIGFYAIYFCAFFIYAFHVPSIAMVFNSLLGIPAFFIFAGLWRYKTFTGIEWETLGISLFAIPAMIWFPKDVVLMVLFVAAYIFLVQQGYEVWKNGPGVLELSFILTMLLSGACWAAFSFWTGQWIVFWFTLSAAPIWFFILYKRYTTPP